MSQMAICAGTLVLMMTPVHGVGEVTCTYWCSFEAGLSEFLGNIVGPKYCWATSLC